ncbi:hypothetical protein D3C79_876770 [compost metagenome]
MSTDQKASLSISLAPGKPAICLFLACHSVNAFRSMPSGLDRVAEWSWITTTRAPMPTNRRAASLPTLPKPCTATLAPSSCTPKRLATSQPVTNTPRPVAFSRPREPPRWIGLPVTTPVMVVPWFME